MYKKLIRNFMKERLMRNLEIFSSRKKIMKMLSIIMIKLLLFSIPNLIFHSNKGSVMRN